MIDRKEFDETFQIFDKETIVEVIDIFMAEYDGRMALIRKNVADRDFAALKLNAHSLKGIVANFKDGATTDHAILFDRMAKESRSEGLDESWVELENKVGQLKEELKAIRQELIS